MIYTTFARLHIYQEVKMEIILSKSDGIFCSGYEQFLLMIIIEDLLNFNYDHHNVTMKVISTL